MKGPIVTERVPAQPKKMLAETNPLLAALVALAVFFGGGGVGNILPLWFAPDSGVAAVVSFLALPGAFMLSMLIWQGLAIISGIVKLLRHGKRTLGDSSIPETLARRAWLLVPMPVLFAIAAGVVTGLLGDVGIVPTVSVYLSVGFLYGMGCFWLGRAGLLPILED